MSTCDAGLWPQPTKQAIKRIRKPEPPGIEQAIVSDNIVSEYHPPLMVWLMGTGTGITDCPALYKRAGPSVVTIGPNVRTGVLTLGAGVITN